MRRTRTGIWHFPFSGLHSTRMFTLVGEHGNFPLLFRDFVIKAVRRPRYARHFSSPGCLQDLIGSFRLVSSREAKPDFCLHPTHAKKRIVTFRRLRRLRGLPRARMLTRCPWRSSARTGPIPSPRVTRLRDWSAEGVIVVLQFFKPNFSLRLLAASSIEQNRADQAGGIDVIVIDITSQIAASEVFTGSDQSEDRFEFQLSLYDRLVFKLWHVCSKERRLAEVDRGFPRPNIASGHVAIWAPL